MNKRFLFEFNLASDSANLSFSNIDFEAVNLSILSCLSSDADTDADKRLNSSWLLRFFAVKDAERGD